MKKTIWIAPVIVVLVALWLGATWYSGKLAETQLNDRIAFVNESWAGKSNPPLQLQIKPIDYKRGLFSTHARYALTKNELPHDLAPEVDITIWHGPFPRSLAPKKFVMHAELVSTGIVKMLTGPLMDGKPPLVIDTGCSYSGLCTSTAHVPAIDFAPSRKIKLAFGGMQAQFDIDDNYNFNINAQLLPLSINNQNFGNGQWTMTADAHSTNSTLSWKTDQGESKLELTILPAPVSDARMEALGALDSEEMMEALKLDFIANSTVSLNVSLSKPMLVDLGALALSLTSGIDLTTSRKQVGVQFDSLESDFKAKQLIRIQGDIITSDWQYTDGKLTINGQENSELLSRFKQIFLGAPQVRQNTAIR